ncbi:hypothetical protein QAD02_015429 [Eretmocerus hayati]|uniref:Uncharacterized protein n=1 Tax=Eretmocerus hayati TaxID=131215 RepID=A0ACC2P8M1_9HYME|nr:hypothetical protein QAD02_015429 [Eretmocerus hayati]
MLQSYEPKKHTIVTKDLLLNLANEQQSRYKRRRTIASLDAVQELRLEHLNILQIDYMWPLTNLVKLKLNNNVIEKIENLDSLKNLCELDLSFNRISKIENLEALTNIHVLSFYNNEIETIEGLDSMQHLTILSMGKNNVLDLEHVVYLRQFKELRSLQMVGNPCTERSGYLSYVIAFIPQLMYYGYKIISDKEREDASEKHRRALSNIIENEMKKQKELEAAKEAEEKVAQLSVAYVEYLDEDCLFQQMFDRDEDGRNIAKLTTEIEEIYNQYKKSFSEVCHDLYELGLKEEDRRREEIQALNNVIDNRLSAATERARKIMDSVKSKREEIRVRVKQTLREAALAADEADLDDETIDEIDKLARQLSIEFNDYASVVWTKLMREETIVHEQIEEMSTMFEANIGDMVTEFLEAAQEYFSQLRNLETEYYENLLPTAMTYVNSLEDEDKSPFVLSITEDKDALNNCLAGSHYMHVQVIDDRQDRMIKRLKDWQAKIIQNLHEDENSRSRNHILEISHFLDHHKRNATVAMLLGQQALEADEDENENEDEEEEGSSNIDKTSESTDQD